MSLDLAVGWLHQRPLPVVVALASYLLCCVAVSCPGGSVSVRACNVCTTPHSMGGYIYCTVAVQFAGSQSLTPTARQSP